LLVDSHCHLNYLDDPGERLAAARARGVHGFLCIGVDASGIEAVLGLAEANPDVWATVGQHPEGAEADPQWVERYLDRPKVLAVGETGLDYYRNPPAEQRALQRARFDYQLELAGRHDLPVVIHTRNAEQDTLDLLRAHPGVRGVLHCFTESWDMAAQALDLGYYVSISGIVTFRNAENVREVARQVPRDRLLVETDSPWLAPVPHRGRTNEPAFVTDTAAYLAELRGWSLEAFAEITTRNFEALFHPCRA
jgi:TatD DNase family protein